MVEFGTVLTVKDIMGREIWVKEKEIAWGRHPRVPARTEFHSSMLFCEFCLAQRCLQKSTRVFNRRCRKPNTASSFYT